ncbi:P2X purinoceptor 4-like [Paramacrobiotus metropolitanus]|uniref:P2X purinoceptor 4-like n=1 Tax=Paramacrobiotus metropolitanus TaxID=2943436 RepID=UPI002445DF68|nr:P2X purinoceptor 4-like [Paramacrobiotus metropolitanus]
MEYAATMLEYDDNERRFSFFTRYNSPRVITLRCPWLGTMYRLSQAAIAVYLICYVVVFTKSYQDTDDAVSSVVSKTKGFLQAENFANKMWDSSDIGFSPQSSRAVFVPTNYVFTPNQTHGNCPEDPNVETPGSLCDDDEECVPDMPTMYGNGIRTGRCVFDILDRENSTCEVHGWCPTERDVHYHHSRINGFESVTVSIRNYIVFPKFQVQRQNIVPQNLSELNCRYHPQTDPYCPIFYMADIIALANESHSQMAVLGGIISIRIDWDCDLDYDLDQCLPVYSFHRLDNASDLIAPGWNFRQSYYWQDKTGIMRRDLIKLYGILLVFNVHGQAGKFSFVKTVYTLGATLGLLEIASMICDFILINFVAKKHKEFERNRSESLIEDDESAAPSTVVTPLLSRRYGTSSSLRETSFSYMDDHRIHPSALRRSTSSLPQQRVVTFDLGDHRPLSRSAGSLPRNHIVRWTPDDRRQRWI